MNQYKNTETIQVPQNAEFDEALFWDDVVDEIPEGYVENGFVNPDPLFSHNGKSWAERELAANPETVFVRPHPGDAMRSQWLRPYVPEQKPNEMADTPGEHLALESPIRTTEQRVNRDLMQTLKGIQSISDLLREKNSRG